jgi:hypothetical protein
VFGRFGKIALALACLAALALGGAALAGAFERDPDVEDVEVLLDENLEVVGTERDWDDDARRGPSTGPSDAQRLTDQDARRAGEAALRVAGGGRVESVERSDDPGEAYEVEVVRGGQEIDVALDKGFKPVRNARYDDE